MNRTATVDVELGGQKILKGDRTLLLYLSGNRDEEQFGPNAHEFDIFRTLNKHQAFGANGRHNVPANLARLELTVLFEEVLDRLPEIRLVGQEKRPERSGNFVLGLESLPVAF